MGMVAWGDFLSRTEKEEISIKIFFGRSCKTGCCMYVYARPEKTKKTELANRVSKVRSNIGDGTRSIVAA